MRKINYNERELFFKNQKTHGKFFDLQNFKFSEKSLSENVFTTFLPLDPEHQNVKNMIVSPFIPNFAPKKLDSIDEGTKSLFKKHLERIKGKKREVLINKYIFIGFYFENYITFILVLYALF